MANQYVSINQLSILTGRDRATITKKLAVLEVRQVGRAKMYDAQKALPVIYGLADEDPSQIKERILKEELRERTARADKLETEVAKTRGQLVAIEDVTKEVAKQFTRVRAAILSLPSRLAKPISMETDPNVVKDLLDSAVIETLEHLSAEDELVISEDDDDASLTTDVSPEQDPADDLTSASEA
jgi:phage terminase Nu1 subunit (DNA packaging protein)